MTFEFDSVKEMQQISDLSPWSVNRHCLNLRECADVRCVQDIDFDAMELWIQIHGLSLDMYNSKNASRIAGLIGKCRQVEPPHVLKQRSFLRVKVEIDTTVPLRDGFWWTNARGEEKWATIRYERLSDYCYGCGRLGHTSTNCTKEVAMAETEPLQPRYGPWLTGVRPRTTARSYHIGSQRQKQKPTRDPNKQSWKDVMSSAKGK